MTGMTAYFGLLDVGALETGDTVVVSGAAGAVGSVVGQIAKIKECRVVGIAGGEAKCRMVTEELGFDACIDYRGEDVRAALRRECPDGIDVYFDNVGGEILDAALANIALHARVVICGAISQYNAVEPARRAGELPGAARPPRADGGLHRVRLRPPVLRGRRRARGLAARGAAAAAPSTSCRGRSTISRTTLQMLFRGENIGKLILELAD